MATTITNLSALNTVIEFAVENGFDNEEIIAKLRHHAEQLAKPSKKPSGPTKNQMINDNLIDSVVEHLVETDLGMSVKDVAAFLSERCADVVGMCSTQKATALMTRAVKSERVRRISDGKTVIFVANK